MGMKEKEAVVKVAIFLVLIVVVCVISLSCRQKISPVKKNHAKEVSSCVMELNGRTMFLREKWEGIQIRGLKKEEVLKFREEAQGIQKSLDKLSKALDEIEKQEE